MGQNESRSTTTAVTPVVTPSKSRFLAVVHHPPSSEMSNDLNNKTCNTTTKFLVPQNRCRRSSDIGDLIRRKRSPSPQHCQTLKFRGINSRRRRLSADDHTSAAASPPSSAEVVLNDFSMSSSSPKKSPNRGRRKSSISIILPSFIGGKRKFFKVIEENQGPPQIPSNEIFVDLDVYSKNRCDDDEEELIRRRNTSRRRAKSINPMHNTAERRQIQQAVNSRKNPQIVPTVFKYHFKKNCNITAPSCVYLAGSMTKWKSQEMGVLKDESYFISVIECTPGKYFYKFCVDGVWCHDESQPFITSSKKDTKANVMMVKQEDREVFDALACDSFAMKNITDKNNYASEDWTTLIPNFDELGPLPSSISNPPFLPPHLSQNILNKKDFESAKSSSSTDSTILPEPMSHVMLHHLYAQSIRDHLLVFASTERYRKKCVTIIYYRPID